MRIIDPTSEEAAAGLRAIRDVAAAPGQMSPSARSMLAAAQGHVLHTSFDVDTLAPIKPAELAGAVTRPEMRQQIVNAMVVCSFIDGEPPAAQSDCVERFAAALGVQSPALSALRHLAHQHRTLYALCIVRNGQLPDMLRDQYKLHGGVGGLAKGLLTLRGVTEDAALADRYRALEILPENRVGKRFWHHYHDHGFAFPGEKHGFPEGGVYHDFSHVLAGYDTSPQGETLVASFTAGYRENRPDHGFFTLLFALSIFSVGIDVTPIKVGARTGTAGPIAVPMIEAIRRGSAVHTDLSDGWDHWPWVDLPLDEARERLGIPPKVEHGPWDYV